MLLKHWGPVLLFIYYNQKPLNQLNICVFVYSYFVFIMYFKNEIKSLKPSKHSEISKGADPFVFCAHTNL